MSRSIAAIVVGVASVHQRDPVLRHAIALAEDLDVELHVVHAYRFTDTVVDASILMGQGEVTLAESFRRTLEQRLRAQVEEISASPRIITRVEAGAADWVLREVGKQIGAALVVVGASHHGTIGRHLLGTTAERVIRESALPVLLLCGPLNAGARRVLFATELSDFSADIFTRGTKLLGALAPYAALQLRPLLVVAHDARLSPPLDRLTLTRVGAAELDRFLEAVPVGGADVEGVVRVGEPAAEILAEARAWPADLIVVGTHGRRGWTRLTLGSVAERVLRDARGNVLVIPAAAAVQTSSATAPAAGAVMELPRAGRVVKRPAAPAGASQGQP